MADPAVEARVRSETAAEKWSSSKSLAAKIFAGMELQQAAALRKQEKRTKQQN